MEQKVVVERKKPKLRATNARDGLNRFMLVDAMLEGHTQLPPVFARLTSISAAHLASVRRSARGFKLDHHGDGGALRLPVGPTATLVEFLVDQAELARIVKLLKIPIHLEMRLWEAVPVEMDWQKMAEIKEFVGGISASGEALELAEYRQFLEDVGPHLTELVCPSSLLPHLPPLGLDKLVLVDEYNLDYAQLDRHTIRRLDVNFSHVKSQPLQEGHVLSASIKALGITWLPVSPLPYDAIEAFSRQFPAFKDLHLSCSDENRGGESSDLLKRAWKECLDARERLHVGQLKKLFITIKHEQNYFPAEFDDDWAEKLRKEEPFDQAIFWTDPSNDHERMLLKQNWAQSSNPTWVEIEANYYCLKEHEYDEVVHDNLDLWDDDEGDAYDYDFNADYDDYDEVDEDFY